MKVYILVTIVILLISAGEQFSKWGFEEWKAKKFEPGVYGWEGLLYLLLGVWGITTLIK